MLKKPQTLFLTIMSKEINNFSFWCPVEISKAVIDEKTGEEIMLLGGIASTADEDSDGEFLDPKGFDIRPLIESGMVNWHHQAKTCPATIVGEPTKAEIRKDGLYIETKLYPSSQVARDIWELAKTLDKDSNTRRLGYSIEGKVLERKSDDKNSPDYKKITKAVITGVAITHQPKNPKTFANIIKGEIDDDLDEEDEENDNEKEKEKNKEAEKSLDTSEGKPLIREDLDRKLKNVTFGKSQVMERIFNDIPSISIEKAKKVYNLIKNISNMAKRNNITDEDILKAYDALGLDSNDIQKGNEDNSSEEEELRKGKKGGYNSDNDYEDEDDDNAEESEDDGEEEEDDEDMNEEEDEENENNRHTTVKKANLFDRFDRIEKAIATSHFHNAKYIKALGVMVKATSDELNKAVDIINLANTKIEELTEINKAQEDTINSLSEQLEAFANSTPAPKSVRHAAAVERNFNKAQENELEKGNGGLTIDVNDKTAVLDILDKATFAKGFDNEFSQACTEFEATGRISPTVISRINKEYGILIR